MITISSIAVVVKLFFSTSSGTTTFKGVVFLSSFDIFTIEFILLNLLEDVSLYITSLVAVNLDLLLPKRNVAIGGGVIILGRLLIEQEFFRFFLPLLPLQPSTSLLLSFTDDGFFVANTEMLILLLSMGIVVSFFSTSTTRDDDEEDTDANALAFVAPSKDRL